MPPEEVTIRRHDESNHVVLTLRGTLSLASASLTVRPAVSKLLLDRSRVIVDLAGTTLHWAPAVELFPAVLARAGGWPLARLVLADADPRTATILRASRVHLTVPLARNVDQARALLEFRPQRVVRSHGLPCASLSPGLARSFVTSMCEDWEFDVDVCERAMTVATELVANAVEHARTGCVLRLAFDSRRLTVAVRDGLPDVGHIPDPGTRSSQGCGLMLVEGLSRSWGVTRHDDGKTVWALLNVDLGLPPRRPRSDRR